MFRIEVPIHGMQTFEIDADNQDKAIALILAGEVEPVKEMTFDVDMDSNNWFIYEAYKPVTICDEVLKSEGYTEIVSQDGKGEVVLCSNKGRLHFFAIRDSYSGWCIETEDGRFLEFVDKSPDDDWGRQLGLQHP